MGPLGTDGLTVNNSSRQRENEREGQDDKLAELSGSHPKIKSRPEQ